MINHRKLKKGQIFLLYSIILLQISFENIYEEFFVTIAMFSFIASTYLILSSELFD